MYTISQISKITSLSKRSLYHYDEIDLCKPHHKNKQGYRFYSEQQVLKLKQIIFLKELGFSLKEIKHILLKPEFDQLTLFKHQKEILILKKEQINKSIKSISSKIMEIQNNQISNKSTPYDISQDQELAQYQKEVKQYWGDTIAYKQSQKNLKKMSKFDIEKIKSDQMKLYKSIAKLMDFKPNSQAVQQKIEQHYQFLHHFYEPNLHMYKGLAKLYIEDRRFHAFFEKIKPGLAQFIHDSIMIYIKK